MVYQYIAYNGIGAMVSGKLSATNEEAATELLSYAGYQVISLKQTSGPFLSEKLLAYLFPVKPAEIALFYRQLALLLESGIAIVACLELLEEQTRNRTLKHVMGEVISELRRGNPLSSAFSKHPKIFSPIHCQSITVGEQAGNLEAMLRQIAEYIEKEVNASKGVKNALTYPIIAAIFTVIVVGVLIMVVLPAFRNLYTSLGAELPTITKLMINLADQLQRHAILIMAGVAVIAGLVYMYIKSPGGKYQWDRLSLRLPLVGRINHLNELARICRSMALLFRAGLPLTETIPLLIQSTGNSVMAQALEDINLDMLKGEGLSRPMAKHDIFLPMMVQMVKVGEETGNLDTTLVAVSQSYETDAEDRTKSLISLIQPAMTALIGVVVGLVALSLISAMYSIYGQVI
ncbi:MAG: type II secretion system F family protein [Chloroflexota bacterium]